MAIGYGYNAFVGWGSEGTYGTPVSAAKFAEINGESLVASPDLINGRSTFRTEVDTDNVKQGRKKVGGNFTMDMRYTGAEQLFYQAFGTVFSAAQSGTDAYTHTFAITDTLPTGLTFEKAADVASFQYHGGKIETLDIQQDDSSMLGLTLGVIAEDEGTVAASNPSMPTSNYFKFNDLAVSFGGTSQNATGLKISLKNNLKADRYNVGARIIKEPIRNGKLGVSGEMTVEFSSITNWVQFNTAGTNALVATWTGDTITGTTANKLVLTLPKVRLTGGVPTVGDSGPISVTIPFTAYADGTGSNNRSMYAELTNSAATIWA